MENLWILLILLYGIFKGIREALKKKATQSHTIMEVLFFYTLFAFLITIPFSRDIFSLSLRAHLVILFKAFVIFLAWICAMSSIKRLPISLYCVTDMSRMVFAILLGVLFLNESINMTQGIGICLVILGVTLVNLLSKKGSGEKPRIYLLFLVLVSCFLNSIAEITDKWLLSPKITDRWFLGTEIVATEQMQFWYMLYLAAFYGLFILIRKEKVDFKKCVKSPYIWLLSLLFVVADRAMFIANTYENSTVVVMTLIKQSSVLVTILLGKLVFKEKNVAKRALCALLVVAGIVISVL
ncbi:MAG: DMT family transporter [Clostridia bacterium]|nr:DMT family transporter [Clostridia bacterium]